MTLRLPGDASAQPAVDMTRLLAAAPLAAAISESKFMAQHADAIVPPTLIGVGGYGRTGKDTLAGRLISEYGYVPASFGETVAELLADINAPVALTRPVKRWFGGTRDVLLAVPWRDLIAEHGYEGAKQFPEVRKLMQDTGEAIKSWAPDFWASRILSRVPEGQKTIITGIRSPMEADRIRERGGLVVRVNKPGVGPLNDHENEKKLDGYEFDVVVTNDGTIEDLWLVGDAIANGTLRRGARISSQR